MNKKPTAEEVTQIERLMQKVVQKEVSVITATQAILIERETHANNAVEERKAKEWIPIKKEIPPNQTLVLLGHKNDGWVVSGERYSKKYWNQFQCDPTEFAEIYPTHWMPLPESPKQ